MFKLDALRYLRRHLMVYRATFGEERAPVKMYVLACNQGMSDVGEASHQTASTSQVDMYKLHESRELRHMNRALATDRFAAASMDGISSFDLSTESLVELPRGPLTNGHHELSIPTVPLRQLEPSSRSG